MTNAEFQKKLEEMYKEYPLIARSKKKTEEIKEKRKRKHETAPSRIDDKPNPRIAQILGKHPNRFRERKSLHLD